MHALKVRRVRGQKGLLDDLGPLQVIADHLRFALQVAKPVQQFHAAVLQLLEQFFLVLDGCLQLQRALLDPFLQLRVQLVDLQLRLYPIGDVANEGTESHLVSQLQGRDGQLNGELPARFVLRGKFHAAVDQGALAGLVEVLHALDVFIVVAAGDDGLVQRMPQYLVP